MKTALNFFAAAALAGGVMAFSPSASAMPAANVGSVVAPQVDQAHAVRVCNRWGRCWWSYAGHRHGGYAWRRPYYGWRGGYAWRGRHYGYGSRHPHYGHGWRGGHRW
jgi:hypothetical protein